MLFCAAGLRDDGDGDAAVVVVVSTNWSLQRWLVSVSLMMDCD